MKTKKQALAYLKSLEGKLLDFDGSYGYQCYDLANFYWYYTTGRTLNGLYAKNIPWDNDFSGYATVYKNTPQFLAKPGDLVVFNGNYGKGAGHVAVVLSATLNKITVIENNWVGGGWVNEKPGWERATKRTHPYDTEMYFIRPKFKSEPKPKKSTSKKNTWNWSGKFTSNTAIKVRKSPSLSNDKNVVDKGSWIKKGDWFDFVQLIKVTKGKKKYWMAKFKYPTNPNAGYFYTTLGELTDKNEKIKKEKKLYGKIKWK